MEEVTLTREILVIIGVAASIAGIIVIPWSIWVTTTLFKVQSDLRVNSQNDKTLMNLVVKVEATLEKLSTDIAAIKLALADKGIKVR